MNAAPGASPPERSRGPLRFVLPALWYYQERKSGSSRLAWDEARYLARLGHEVWLVAQHAGQGGADHAVDAGVHVLRYRRPAWAAFDFRPRGVHLARARRLLLDHVPGDVDVVHCHSLLTGAAAIGLYGGRARTCYSIHSTVRHELAAAGRGAPWRERARLRLAAAARSRLERQCLEQCHALTSDSEYTRRLVSGLHGEELAARVGVAPGWVDLAKFRVLDDPGAARQALGWPSDRPVFVCLRRLVPRMGIDRLLEAASILEVSGRRFLLVVAGDGVLRKRLEAQARSLALQDTVRFVGEVDDDLAPTMVGAADAFVLPTADLECFGLIVLEALACGRPVLATPVGAIPELLGRVERGWMAAAASAAAMADLLGRYLDGLLPAHRPEALREVVARDYSIADRLPRLVAIALGAAEAP